MKNNVGSIAWYVFDKRNAINVGQYASRRLARAAANKLNEAHNSPVVEHVAA
jgi:hypothetical protein